MSWENHRALWLHEGEEIIVSTAACSFCVYLPTCGDIINTSEMFTRTHLHLILTEANHIQGSPHHLPVAAVVDGAHFGAVTLWETQTCIHSITCEAIKQVMCKLVFTCEANTSLYVM